MGPVVVQSVYENIYILFNSSKSYNNLLETKTTKRYLHPMFKKLQDAFKILKGLSFFTFHKCFIIYK